MSFLEYNSVKSNRLMDEKVIELISPELLVDCVYGFLMHKCSFRLWDAMFVSRSQVLIGSDAESV